MFEVVKTNNESDVQEEFVALGTFVNNGIAQHSVIVVRYQSQFFIFHYPGHPLLGILEDNAVPDNCFHKITETVDKRLIPSFIVMCRQIIKRANPRYGFFYSGEFYDRNGLHFSQSEVGETMTCAGFCINVFKGFLEEDYILYSDWDPIPYPSEQWLTGFATRHNLDVNKIADAHRRISPLELLCSGFYTVLPIRKKQIDTKVEETEHYLQNY